MRLDRQPNGGGLFPGPDPFLPKEIRYMGCGNSNVPVLSVYAVGIERPQCENVTKFNMITFYA